MIPRIRDQQYRDVYANSHSMGIGPYDITITFQRMSEIIPGQPGFIDMIAIILSPQNFKGFVRAASEVLKAYENVFGPLAIPDQETTPTRSAIELEGMIKAARNAAAATIAKANPSSTAPPQPSKRSRGVSPKKAPEP
jgi:hypothetical protein